MLDPAQRAIASPDSGDRQVIAARLALYGGAAACAAGFVWHGMWRVLPWERFALSLLLAAIALGLAWPLRRFARWSWASALATVWAAALVVWVGPLPMLAALALAAMALALGLIVVPAGIAGRLAVSTLLGLALIAGLGGWTLLLPVHHTPAWWIVVAGVVAWRRRAVLDAVMEARRDWRRAVAEAPRWAALAVMLLGLASTACWLPTMQVDDLAYHLGLPSQLLRFREYRPDPAHQVWAYAPWAGDALQGFAAVLAGGHARGGMNALWLALAAGAIASACAGAGARATERWAGVALFASLPPLVWMAAGMQTELPATAVLAALAAVILAPVRDGTRDRLLPGAILFGALFAIKGVHVLSGLPLLLYAVGRHGHATRWSRVPLALIFAAAVGASSYAYSWWATGNPVLPLFNAYFQSPYFPVDGNYADPRWHAGFGPTLPWRIVFDTDRYVEAWDGGIGFSLIALSGMWLVSLLRPPTRGLALACTLALLLPLLPMQYVRYAYPGLLLMAMVWAVRGRERFGPRHFAWAVLGACALNLAFQANASWLHHSAALKRVIRSGGDAAAVYPHYVPERMLLQRIPSDDPGLVLATNPSRGYVAELAGRGRVTFDHDPRLREARMLADADRSGAAWGRLFAGHRIGWVLVTPESASPALHAGLHAHARRVAGIGDAELWRVAEGDAP